MTDPSVRLYWRTNRPPRRRSALASQRRSEMTFAFSSSARSSENSPVIAGSTPLASILPGSSAAQPADDESGEKLPRRDPSRATLAGWQTVADKSVVELASGIQIPRLPSREGSDLPAKFILPLLLLEQRPLRGAPAQRCACSGVRPRRNTGSVYFARPSHSPM